MYPVLIFRSGAISKFEHTVDLHLAVRDDRADLALLLEVLEALTSQGAVDLESVDQSGDGHQAVGLDILVQLLRGGLVEDDSVLGLVLDYCPQRQKMSASVL